MNSIDHYNATPRPTESEIVNEGGYVHKQPGEQLTVEMSNIAPESRVTTHGKTYIYTKDLSYFANVKKTSKIWEYDLEVLEIDTMKKF